MGSIVDFVLGLKMLPATISSAFAAILILGVVYIFVSFLFKTWKSYHNFMMLQIKDEEELKDSKKDDSDHKFSAYEVDTMLDVYKKLIDVTENIAGKYVKKNEFEKFSAEMKSTTEGLEKEIEDLKKRFGID